MFYLLNHTASCLRSHTPALSPGVSQQPLPLLGSGVCLDSTSNANGFVLCEETNGACHHPPLTTTTQLTRPYTALTRSGWAQR